MKDKLDDIDEKIIRILWGNGRITMQQLGREVHLTGQAVRNRVEKLESLGIIHHYTVNINCPVYGCKIHALIRLAPGLGQRRPLEQFLRRSPCRILHCYYVTGRQSFVIDVFFLSEAERDAFLSDLSAFGSFEVDIVLDTLDIDGGKT